MGKDAERLITAWNERRARRMPTIFSPTNGAAIASRYWFLWVRCPACRSTSSVDLRRRPSPGHRGDEPHSRAVMPVMPAQRAAYAGDSFNSSVFFTVTAAVLLALFVWTLP